MTQDEAKNKICPIMSNQVSPYGYEFQCITDRCMAWEQLGAVEGRCSFVRPISILDVENLVAKIKVIQEI